MILLGAVLFQADPVRRAILPVAAKCRRRCKLFASAGPYAGIHFGRRDEACRA